MNAIFLGLFLAASVCLLIVNPDIFLPTVLDSATDSATLCVSLLASYAVWMGLMQVWKDSGVTKGFSRLLRPLSKRLFRTNDEETLQAISANLACNMLGIGGAATPYGIRAAQLMDKSKHAEYSSAMFFALNATSIQLLPTSVIGIRASMGSGAPADIVLPTLITTAVSTFLACFLTWIFLRPRCKKNPKKQRHTSSLFPITSSLNRGAGLR